ncbi:MAG: hypothetical protein IJU65_05415 [Desulfovibrio sp.]|nr:hypothetical protein [Desulfovibrio sp.]
MKRVTGILAVVVLLLGGAALGLHMWLQSAVEELARESIASLPLIPGGAPAKGSVENAHFIPLSRTLYLTRIHITDPAVTGLESSIESISLRFTPRFLLALTPLRNLVLPTQEDDMLAVVEYAQFDNLEWKMRGERCSLKQYTAETVHVTAGMLASLIDGRNTDPLDVIYHAGADSLRARGLSIKSFDRSDLNEIILDESVVVGWEGSSIHSSSLTGLHGRAGKEEIFSLQTLQYGGITLPEPDLLRQFWQEFLKHGNDSDALWMACRPLLDKMTEKGALAETVRIGTLHLYVNGQPVRLDEGGFDYPSVMPRHIAGFLRGLSLPRSLFKDSGLALPDLMLDFSGSVEVLDEGRENHSYDFKASGLADVECSFALHGKGSLFDEQAVLTHSVSNVRLMLQDRGVMAWMGRNMGGSPTAVVTRLERALNELELQDTPQNRQIQAYLRTFIRHPGSLEVQSLSEKPVGLIQLLETLVNPGALFTLRVTPGAVSLEDAIRALPAVK